MRRFFETDAVIVAALILVAGVWKIGSDSEVRDELMRFFDSSAAGIDLLTSGDTEPAAANNDGSLPQSPNSPQSHSVSDEVEIWTTVLAHESALERTVVPDRPTVAGVRGIGHSRYQCVESPSAEVYYGRNTIRESGGGLALH